MAFVHHTRLGRVWIAGAVLTAVAVVAPVVPVVPAAAAVGAVHVTPAGGLVATQTVSVEASGLGADQTAGASECRTGGTPLGSGCGPIAVAPALSDGTGGFTTSLTVQRFISVDNPVDGFGTIIDCAVAPGTCSVVVGTIDGSTASAPLAFVPAPPPTPPTAAGVTAAPTTELIEGQAVSLRGSDFTPGAPVLVQLCATGGNVCATYGLVATDAAGGFTFAPTVRSTVDGTSCSTSGPCVLRVTDLTGVVRSSGALSFGPPATRTLSVTPSTGLVDGQSVSVTGTGFAANASTGVGECPAGTAGDDCFVFAVLTTDARGAFTTTVPVRRQLTFGSRSVDCASSDSACVIAAATGDDISGTLTVVPVHFRHPSPHSIGECLHGGWRRLSDGAGRPFRNLGSCVLWVVFHRRR